MIYDRRSLERKINEEYNIGINLTDQPISLKPDLYRKISNVGSLVFGEGANDRSLFSTMLKVAKENEGVFEMLSKGATNLGRRVNRVVAENYDDPFYNTFSLFRPDILIGKNQQQYIGEFEVVVGGMSKISLLQKLIEGESVLFAKLMSVFEELKQGFSLSGVSAFLFYEQYASEVTNYKWLEAEAKKYGVEVVVSSTTDLEFKNDGVYLSGKKVAVAYTFVKSHKHTLSASEKDNQLVEYWLQKKIALVSPPTILVDNKLWSALLHEEEIGEMVSNEIGLGRYNELMTSIPQSIVLTPKNLNTQKVRRMLDEPLKANRYVIKYPFWWGSKNMLFSPVTEKGANNWVDKVQRMISQNDKFGYPMLQEFIDTQKYGYLDGQQGTTKIIPFFVYNPISNKQEYVGTFANVVPNSLIAHISSKGRIAPAVNINLSQAYEGLLHSRSSRGRIGQHDIYGQKMAQNIF